MIERDVYKTTWQTGESFETLKANIGVKREKAQRFVTIAVQKERICLMLNTEGAPYYAPYVHEEGAWRPVNARDIKVDAVSEHALVSEENLDAALHRQMLLQFRDSICSYYDEYPDADTICATLDADPRMSTMCRYRYVFHLTDVEDDPEWDGAYNVYCAKGSLVIPYVEREPEEIDDPRLLMQHATFIPDSGMANVAGKAGGFFGRIGDAIRNLHWSNVRQTLNGAWR